ncbi:MAG: HD domain-containing protein [Bacteriovoracaceae bacterium]|nr:HD domain-containing protein [Bacteriovoracaceae bacterium]
MDDKSISSRAINAIPKKHLIYDVLYGFIQLTPLEWEIIQSPFFQRLRWIKQLGFSFYTFPGAEHSRYGHSIGVMYNAHSILQSIGKAVPDEILFQGNLISGPNENSEVKFHQSIRVAALLHDIGTFPFSHTTEASYIKFAETKNSKSKPKAHPDNHEHLGSFIIKKTKGPQGITTILEKYGLDPKEISDLVKGIGPNFLANQIIHSEVDCDRMDYLLRDAHYTGLNYGAYDRDYLLHHFRVVKIAGQEILAINEKAIYCIQDFLMSRFAWYSQVIRSARGAKFDALAEDICFHLLQEELIYRYGDLLDMVENDPERFYGFNDHYFIVLLQKLYYGGHLKDHARIADMVDHLIHAKSPRTVRIDQFNQKILDASDLAHYHRAVKRAKDKLEEMQDYLSKRGGPSDWIVDDLPKKDIFLLKSQKTLVRDKTTENVLWERDPTKIVRESGEIFLLSDIEESLISLLQNKTNFLPNVFCSHGAFDLLSQHFEISSK